MTKKKDYILHSRKPLFPIIQSSVSHCESMELNGKKYIKVFWHHRHDSYCPNGCDIEEDEGYWKAISDEMYNDLMNQDHEKNNYFWRKLRNV